MTGNLQRDLWATEIWRRLPMLGTLVVLNAIAFGRPGVASWGVASAITWAVTHYAHRLASMMVMPSQQDTHKMRLWLHGNPTVRKYAPELANNLVGDINHGTATRAHLPQQRRHLQETHGGERLRITCPDGVQIDAMFYGRLGLRDGESVGSKHRGVILYLGGNGEHYEFRSDLMSYRRAGFGLMLLNYRGVGESKGTTTRSGMVVDAASALAFLTHECRVPAQRIIVLGHSMGGGVGAEAATYFP
jgi:hypothetical protein